MEYCELLAIDPEDPLMDRQNAYGLRQRATIKKNLKFLSLEPMNKLLAEDMEEEAGHEKEKCENYREQALLQALEDEKELKQEPDNNYRFSGGLTKE
ncbi:hypothetical protein MMC11_005503 [Xylographa trunciseda]|nr:hypothetical protein [Xylographa trunciseda]